MCKLRNLEKIKILKDWEVWISYIKTRLVNVSCQIIYTMKKINYTYNLKNIGFAKCIYSNSIYSGKKYACNLEPFT